MQCGCNQMGLRGYTTSDLCAEQGCLPVAVCVPASGTEEEERKKMRVMQASASESKVMYRRCRMRRRDEGQLLVRDGNAGGKEGEACHARDDYTS